MIIRYAEVDPSLVRQDKKKYHKLHKEDGISKAYRPIYDTIIMEIFIIVEQVLSCQSYNVQKVALDIMDCIKLER